MKQAYRVMKKVGRNGYVHFSAEALCYQDGGWVSLGVPCKTLEQAKEQIETDKKPRVEPELVYEEGDKYD